MINSQWPVRGQEQAILIIASVHTSTHTIDCTEDGIVSIQRNELRDASQDPEIMQETEGLPNYSILNQENIDALLSVLVQAKQHFS